jgi:hypothetical protein
MWRERVGKAVLQHKAHGAQVLTLGDAELISRVPAGKLDLLEQKATKSAAVASAVTYISTEEAGGLTAKGVANLFRKLPLMHGLRELRVVGVGYRGASHDDVVRALAAGLAGLPSLQVRLSPGLPNHYRAVRVRTRPLTPVVFARGRALLRNEPACNECCAFMNDHTVTAGPRSIGSAHAVRTDVAWCRCSICPASRSAAAVPRSSCARSRAAPASS